MPRGPSMARNIETAMHRSGQENAIDNGGPLGRANKPTSVLVYTEPGSSITELYAIRQIDDDGSIPKGLPSETESALKENPPLEEEQRIVVKIAEFDNTKMKLFDEKDGKIINEEEAIKNIIKMLGHINPSLEYGHGGVDWYKNRTVPYIRTLENSDLQSEFPVPFWYEEIFRKKTEKNFGGTPVKDWAGNGWIEVDVDANKKQLGEQIEYAEGGEVPADKTSKLPKAQDGWFNDAKEVGKSLWAARSPETFNKRLYETVTPIGYDWKHAVNEYTAGERLPFMWDGESTSWDTFQDMKRWTDPVTGEKGSYGQYAKDASMDAWGMYLGQGQKHGTFVKSKYESDFDFGNTGDVGETTIGKEQYYDFNWVDDIYDDIISSGITGEEYKEGTIKHIGDSASGGFTLNDYAVKKGYDKVKDLSYIEYSDEYDFDIPFSKFKVPAEWIAGEPFKIKGRMYYTLDDGEVNIVDRDQTYAHDVKLEDLKKGIKWAESKDGKYMKNPESTASGLYGQLFSEIEDDYGKSRDEFIKDYASQNEYFQKRFSGDIEGVPGIKESVAVLWKKYGKYLQPNGYTPTDLGAIINLLGRQGARKWAGNVLRDKDSLEVVFPNLYSSGANQSNKTPHEYIEEVREGIAKKVAGGEIIARAKQLYASHKDGGKLNYADRNYLQSLGLIKAQSGIEVQEPVQDSTHAQRMHVRRMAIYNRLMEEAAPEEIPIDIAEPVESEVVELEPAEPVAIAPPRPVVTTPRKKTKPVKKVVSKHTTPPVQQKIEEPKYAGPTEHVWDEPQYDPSTLTTPTYNVSEASLPNEGLDDMAGYQEGVMGYLSGNQGILPGDQTKFKEDATGFIEESISQDIANVLPMSIEDKIAIGKEYIYKKTKTGPYSEEAIEAQKLELYQAKERQLEKDAAEAERVAEAERLRLEKLIFSKEHQLSKPRFTYGSGHQRKSAVIDLGTSGGRPGVKFGLGHNTHAPKGMYSNRPNKPIKNSQGIIGAFHNEFVPYSETSNHKFKVPVQLAWNSETGVFTAKKTKDLDENDLVVSYGRGRNSRGGNIHATRLEDLDIKKLEDGSF